MNGAQKEILFSKEMLDFVDKKADFLKVPTEAWTPTEFLPDFSDEDWPEQVKLLQSKAMNLGDAFFMSLTGNMVTEEGLPCFLTWLNQANHVGDKSGTDDHPWARWARYWTAEENKHGDLLHKYLYLSGRVDMAAVERSIGDFIRHGFNSGTENCPYRGFAFTSFQERATRISHSRIANDAKEAGADDLARMCQVIAVDEGRHEAVYQGIIDQVFKFDRSAMMVAFMETMKTGIVMPFRATGKDCYSFFSEVTEAIGMYTYSDYIEILEYLIKKWKLEQMSDLTSEAQKSQDYICSLPKRYKRIAERKNPKTLDDITRPYLWVRPRASKTKTVINPQPVRNPQSTDRDPKVRA